MNLEEEKELDLIRGEIHRQGLLLRDQFPNPSPSHGLGHVLSPLSLLGSNLQSVADDFFLNSLNQLTLEDTEDDELEPIEPTPVATTAALGNHHLTNPFSYQSNYSNAAIRSPFTSPYFYGDELGGSNFGVDGLLGRNSYFTGIPELGIVSPTRYLINENGAVASNSPIPPHQGTFSSNLHYKSPVPSRWAGESLRNVAPRTPYLAGNSVKNEAFGCEDCFILQSKGMNYVESRRSQSDRNYVGSNCPYHPREWRGSLVANTDRVHSPRLHSSPIPQLKYGNMISTEGSIYHIAMDHYGCKFLQQKLEEGNHEVERIFNGTIDHIVELAVNPSGNYLLQKLLGICSEEQRMRIILMLTRYPGNLVRISLDSNGTRVVQKLVDTIKTPQQIDLVVAALQPGFLDLIYNVNGKYVVLHCLERLEPEFTEFIFDGAAKHCVNISTHQHGCSALQCCIGKSTGEHQANLVAGISAHGLQLAQDGYGNYVVQYILGLEIPSAIATLASQFEGNYVHLSKIKCSSFVVEKCLKVFGEDDRARIIMELLSVSRFDHLLLDPWANYVVQSAFKVSKGPLYFALDKAIRTHEKALRTIPYCKKIFSRTRLKR